jgi:WD40 repeat protein
MSLKTFRPCGVLIPAVLFLSVAVAQQPAKPSPFPAINAAGARLDGTAGGLDGPGFAIAADEAAGVVAAACEEGTIRYWRKDVVLGIRCGGQTPNVLSGHKGPVLALAWAPSAGLISAGDDQKIIRWNLAEAKPQWTISAGTTPRALALSPDGKTLAGAGDDQVVRLWQAATGKPVEADKKPVQFKGHTDWVLCLAFSSDGKTLASAGHDGSVYLWDLTAGKKLREIVARAPAAPNTEVEPPESVYSLAFSPDDKQLAVGNTEQVFLFTVADGKYVRTLAGHTSSVTGLAYHPGGTVLASASKDRTLRLWNPANGQALKTLEGHTAWVQGVTFVAKGTRLASVGADETVRFWDLTQK